jgi:L-rhamnose-H+ transport protein
MHIVPALLLILAAGVINGSFALPTKYIVKWRFENIWLQYALWAFVVLPWLSMFILEPKVFSIYAASPFSLLCFMLAGGFIFGAGQICFALAIDMIGIGLGFVINLGLGIGLGFLLPLVIQHPHQIPTPFGFLTLLGTALAVAGLIVSNHAGLLRDRQRSRPAQAAQGRPGTHALGVLLAALAGLSSAGQNVAFSLTGGLQVLAVKMGAGAFAAANILWPGFLLCGFIPYALYTLRLHRKNDSFALYKEAGTAKYHVFALAMGACWYGSLLFYSKASQLIGDLGPLVGWPMFMVLIILTSSFWGWRHKEWDGCGPKAMAVMRRGLALLMSSILVLGYSSSLH